MVIPGGHPRKLRLMYSLNSSLPSNEDENANSGVILPAFPSFCGHFRPLPCPHSVLAVPPGRPQCRPGRHCHGGDEAAPRPQRGDARAATPSSTTTADGSAASARVARTRRSPPSSRHSSQSSTENQQPPKHRRPQRFCFTTDPFMHEYDEIAEMSIAAISKLNKADLKCTVLTKGILPQVLADLSAQNEYGITLVSLNEQFREEIEPGAAPISQRLQALRMLHDKGCATWVSIEPYPTPNIIKQNLHELLKRVSFVDKIIFGRMNYSREVSSYQDNVHFYNETTKKVIEFCKKTIFLTTLKMERLLIQTVEI